MMMRKIFGFLFFLQILFSLSSQEEPVEPLWKYSAGGRIYAVPVQGPDGSVYIISENRALHSVSPARGIQNWIFRPGRTLQPVIVAAPDGTIYIIDSADRLFAVNAGGLERWSVQLDQSPAVYPVCNPWGDIVVLTEQNITSYSRKGRERWKFDLDSPPLTSAAVDSEGRFYFADESKLYCYDQYGQAVWETDISFIPSTLILSARYRTLLTGTANGSLEVFNLQGESLWAAPRQRDARIVSILENRTGYTVFFADGTLVEYNNNGFVVTSRETKNPGGEGASSRNGEVYLYSANGQIFRYGSDDVLRISPDSVIVTPPLITDRDILVTGGNDWVLYGYESSGISPGWAQFRGNSRRNGLVVSETADRNARLERYRKDPVFIYLHYLIDSGELGNLRIALDELKKQNNQEKVQQNMPYYDIIMEDLAGVGTLTQPSRYGQGNDPALIRAEAYQLIGQWDDFRLRKYLLYCLQAETDTYALSVGFHALGRIGVDYDGSSVRLINEKLREFPQEDRLSVSAVNAVAAIVDYNGYVTDQSGFDLILYVLNSGISDRSRSIVYDIYKSFF